MLKAPNLGMPGLSKVCSTFPDRKQMFVTVARQLQHNDPLHMSTRYVTGPWARLFCHAVYSGSLRGF